MARKKITFNIAYFYLSKGVESVLSLISEYFSSINIKYFYLSTECKD